VPTISLSFSILMNF